MSFLPVQGQTYKLYGAGTAVGDTTVKLVSFTQIDGTTLTMTNFGSKGFITIEPQVSNEEQISFTGITQNGDGTATLTGVKTVSFVDPYTETSGIAKVHAGGTIAVVSNTAGFYNQFFIKENANTVTGTTTFSASIYVPTPTEATQAATKDYVDNVAIAGAPDASTTVKGIAKLSTAPSVGTNPIVVGDNDTRVPTQGENDALVGTRGTPSSSNKFVTNDDTSTTGTTSYVARYSGTGILTVAATPTNTTDAASKGYVDTKTTATYGTLAFAIASNGTTSATTVITLTGTQVVVAWADGVMTQGYGGGIANRTLSLAIGGTTYSKTFTSTTTVPSSIPATLICQTPGISGTALITISAGVSDGQNNIGLSGTLFYRLST